MQDFSTWYTERHGYEPFPWQSALADRIAVGDWPEALTPPTGSGKTAIIDVWLWARLSALPVPRRLVYVIDRRLVVDGASEYASALAASLKLEDRPAVVTMRGGLAIEDDWLANPLGSAVIVSTVDQVGSRLLFSGYGISPRAAPIHAALLGNDALFVIDEVHLVTPLLQTLASITEQRKDAIPLPWRVLPMSATWTGANVHGLTAADWSHPVLSRRLKSPKPCSLVKLKKDADVPEALAAEALKLRQQGADVIAVVCNRVGRARAVFERLKGQGEAVLLTGRVRPHDKDALSAEFLPRIAVGTRGSRAPLFVVATQTIEVGADLDVDALVTECASLSALRQRAGRLNRLGELLFASMVIVYQTPLKKPDPVYGDGIEAAWKWLTAAADKSNTVDFGILAMQSQMAKAPPPAEAIPSAPVLLSGHVHMLSRTSVAHGIEIAPWLHGWQTGRPDVYLCWRADWCTESVTAAPPVQHELLAIPLYALRRWTDDVADLEGSSEQEVRSHPHPLTCIRWDGDVAQDIGINEVRAGDTLVLPSEKGGCDRFGWAPDCRDRVTDLGDSARRVRLHPALRPELADAIHALLDDEGTTDEAWRALARDTGTLIGEPGRVMPYPGGCLVLCAAEWTSQSALRKIPLSDHQRAVSARAEALASGSGLGQALIDAIRRAGAGHDTGKQDERWQLMVGGDRTNLLAKGPGGDTRWPSLPRGWRHEMASAIHYKDPLVRHLIGSHHGHGRPLLPASPDIALWRDLEDWAESWADLQHTYGPWGLAYLEALVRLADWSISAEEQA